MDFTGNVKNKVIGNEINENRDFRAELSIYPWHHQSVVMIEKRVISSNIISVQQFSWFSMIPFNRYFANLYFFLFLSSSNNCTHAENFPARSTIWIVYYLLFTCCFICIILSFPYFTWNYRTNAMKLYFPDSVRFYLGGWYIECVINNTIREINVNLSW